MGGEGENWAPQGLLTRPVAHRESPATPPTSQSPMMGIGGLRQGTTHCMGGHRRLQVLPRDGAGRGQPGMWQQTVPRCPAVRKEAAQRCLYRLFVVRLFGTWGAHGEHNTGAPRGAATRTAKLWQGRGTPRPLLLPPTRPGLPLPRPGQSPPPKGHQGSSLRGPGTRAPHSICRRGCVGTDPQGTFHLPSPRGGSPGCWGGSGV